MISIGSLSFNISWVFHNLIFVSILACLFQQNLIKFHDLSKTTIRLKDMKILSSKLDIPSDNPTSIKFLKDPSTRGNSPIFQNQKMKMKPTLPSIKPVNKDSSLKSNFSKWANLVKSTGIGPMKYIYQVNKIKSLLSQNLKSCLKVNWNFEDKSCYKIELEMELAEDLHVSQIVYIN